MHRYLIPVLLAALLACQSPPTSESASSNHLGEISLKVTGAEVAMPAFEEGLLLLHSFEYADSRTSFQAAQAEDSSFAMAYWGEAMTYNHNLWSEQEYEKGTATLALMEQNCDLQPLTALEKDLIQAVRVLYGEGEKLARDQAYAEFLGELHEKHPENHEVAAFYALSLMGAVPYGRDGEVSDQSAAIARGIMEENANHPGGLHYLIHAYDEPSHAQFALEAANAYAKVAPDAAHALHMPSHIYVALGMWKEVISSNIASYNASINRMERMELKDDARSYHAFAWLQYGHMQLGEMEPATKIMEDMVGYHASEPAKRTRAYYVSMIAAYLTEIDSWEDQWIPAMKEIKTDDLNMYVAAVQQYVLGRHAHSTRDATALQTAIDQIYIERQRAAQQLTPDGISSCGAVTRSTPNQLNIDHASIMEMQLRALLADMQGNPVEAEEWLKESVALETSLSYSSGPPDIPSPSWEFYGEWLLDQERPADALKQFELALARNPQRRLSLQGLATAQKAVNAVAAY
ncbi:MAG: hypothetical protein AAF399_14225 [Bacteroidota bacterium]